VRVAYHVACLAFWYRHLDQRLVLQQLFLAPKHDPPRVPLRQLLLGLEVFEHARDKFLRRPRPLLALRIDVLLQPRPVVPRLELLRLQLLPDADRDVLLILRRDRLLKVHLPDQLGRAVQLLLGGGILGVERHDLLEVAERGLGFENGEIGNGPAVVRLDVSRVELDRLASVVDGQAKLLAL
jgi:hypothetical protein